MITGAASATTEATVAESMPSRPAMRSSSPSGAPSTVSTCVALSTGAATVPPGGFSHACTTSPKPPRLKRSAKPSRPSVFGSVMDASSICTMSPALGPSAKRPAMSLMSSSNMFFLPE